MLRIQPVDRKNSDPDILSLLQQISSGESRWNVFEGIANQSIEIFNTLFPLFHEVKKGTCGVIRPASIRKLTDSRQYSKYCPFLSVIPVEFQPPDMPATCHFFRRFNDRNVPFPVVLRA